MSAWTFTVFGLAFLVLAGTVKSQECPDGFFRISSFCYFIYNGTEELFSWSEARQQCKRLDPNADLLEIHDQATQDALNVVISLISWPVWIGLSSDPASIVDDSSYRWISKRTDTYSNWASTAFEATEMDSGRQCVFLSTASLHVGAWDHCSCEKARMGFGCWVYPNLPPPLNSTTHLEGAQPPWTREENEAGQICYLNKCYRLISSGSVGGTFNEAVAACGDEAVALPRNPLEFAFLKNRLATASKSVRAWLGVEVTNTGDRLEFTRSNPMTPWLTAAIHHTQPKFPIPPSNQSETFCLQMDISSSLSTSPFLAVHCMGVEDEEVEVEDDASMAVFCAAPEVPIHGNCPEDRNTSYDVTWHAFGDECFAVMKSCVGDSVPAILQTPEADAFATWLLSTNSHIDDDVHIGGIVNTTTPLTITWLDGSVSRGFNRLKPSYMQKILKNDLCLAIEPNTGWWVLRECKGQRAPSLTLCTVPIKPQNHSSSDLSSISKNELSCPEDYIPFRRVDGSLTCYRVVLGGSRSHNHNWRAAERACRKVTSNNHQNTQWLGHLASLPNETTSDNLISLLQQKGFAAGITASSDNLPPHLVKLSEFVWLGLSKSNDNLSWNNWTDGLSGNVTFYEDRVRQHNSFSVENSAYFFDHGSCIALHLLSGSWYSLRCTLELGYICQAILASGNETEDNDHFNTPNCLISSNPQYVTVSTETGFIHDSNVDCVASGFTYFNGQCFRTFHDEFMTFAEAQTHCHNIGSPYSRDGKAGLAVLRSKADQLFVASQLSRLSRFPSSPAFYGRGSAIYEKLEVIWRRYHWVGLFHYRHSFHSVDERVPCYVDHELNRPLVSSIESPLCVSITGVPDTDHFGSLTFDIGCNERLPFVCSFEPSQARIKAEVPDPICPKGYATHHAATGNHCYRFISDWTGNYEEAAAMCAQTAPAARLAALTTPFTVAWLRAHLPSDHTTTGMLPWDSVPHWIGLKLQARNESSWRWANGLPVTHTRWSTRPNNVVNSSSDTCFAFAKSISMTSYELDMVVVDCLHRLSPLCEADPLTKSVVPNPEPDEEYTEADQRDYNGRIDKSASGKACIRWDLISLTNSSEMDALRRAFHNATLAAVVAALEVNTSTSADLTSPVFQPVFSSVSNWCRNPAGLRGRVFCFVDVDKWEFCTLPLSSKSSSSPSLASSNSTTSAVPVIFSIMGIFLSILLLILLCFLLLCFHRKNRRRWTSTSPVQQMLLQRLPLGWRWRWARTASQPCLLADNVSYSAGTEPIDVLRDPLT